MSGSLRKFGIFSPTLGQRKDIPNIMLSNAVTADSSGVSIWDGEIRKQKMRVKELVRTTYQVASINTSTETVKITGSYVAFFPSGANITLYNLTDDAYEDHVLSTTSTYDGTETTLTVAGDLTVSSPTERVFLADGVTATDPADADFLKVGTPDSNAILRYERFVLSDGTERLVAFTATHIYYWDTVNTEWHLLFTSAGTATYWDACQYGDYLCATNNIDRPQSWDGGAGTTFENLDTAYSTTSSWVAKAKFITNYHNYLILANVELSNGTRYQHHAYTSTLGEGVMTGGFRQDTGGDAGAYYIQGNGEIEGGLVQSRGLLYVFKSRSVTKMWFVGGAIPLAQVSALEDVGCSAPGSVGNDWSDNLFYYGSDATFREVVGGQISQAINPTVRDINPSLLEHVRFQALDEFQELRWAIPYGSEATANNKVIVFKEGAWHSDYDIAVSAFGEYKRQINYTWDNLPFESWADWGWGSWESTEETVGFPRELCADHSGNTYLMHGAYTDDGSAYDSYFVMSTDLTKKQTLYTNKRVLQLFVYVYGESEGTLSLSVKRDNEAVFQSLGDVSLVGSEEIVRVRLPVDFRGRHFLIKVLGTAQFRFVGIEFEYVFVGDR